jgi:hypothetical protein
MVSYTLLTIDEGFPPLSSKVPPTIKILDIILSSEIYVLKDIGISPNSYPYITIKNSLFQ